MTLQHPCSTLERVADLLPPPDKARFLLVVARFQNVPHDDEYLQVLEAIGFMTLLWKAVPAEIQSLLEGANPAHETAASIAKLVRDAVAEAIPSQQDLRSVAQTLREHETALRGVLRSTPQLEKRASPLSFLVILVGLGALALVAERFGFIRLF